MAADVVAERELGALHLARPRLAAQLEQKARPEADGLPRSLFADQASRS